MAKRIDAGCDYIRVTTTDTEAKKKMEEEYLEVMAQDKILGYKEHKGGAFGFAGWACRHALVAVKEDRTMLQVSGKYAKRPFMRLPRECQATRIDVQITVQLEEQHVGTYLKSLHDKILARPRREGHQATTKAIMEEGVLQTIYIGSRSSDWFFRIYDKFAETGLEEYRDCVRFELELKGRASKGIWRFMAEQGKGLMFLLAIMEQKFAEYAVDIPDADGWGRHEWRPPKDRNAIEATMAWLNRAVAPSFKRLSSELGWLKPLMEIISDTLYDDESAVVAREIAKVWGS